MKHKDIILPVISVVMLTFVVTFFATTYLVRQNDRVKLHVYTKEIQTLRSESSLLQDAVDRMRIENKNQVEAFAKAKSQLKDYEAIVNIYQYNEAEQDTEIAKYKKQIADIKSSLDREKRSIKAMKIVSEFLPKVEGFRQCPYFDVDHYSIGFGTKSGKNNSCIDRYEAKKAMIGEIYFITKELREKYPYVEELNEYILASIISFRYNLGVGKFNNTHLAYLLKHKAPTKLIKSELVNQRKDQTRGARELMLANWGEALRD